MAFSYLLNRIKGEKSPSSSNEILVEDPLLTKAHQSGDIFKEAEYFSIAEADIDGQ